MDVPALTEADSSVAIETTPPPSRRSVEAQVDLLRPDPALMSAPDADRLITRLGTYVHDSAELARAERLIRTAYAIAYEAHRGQWRKSGESYITHPIAVAEILIELQLDAESIAAALLHDVVEDTGTTSTQLEVLFGRDIAHLVDGVTKLSRLENQSKEEAQAGTYRKMFIAMADDPRVVLVKLADRLHNMRTLNAKELESQQKTARETMDIYAPLASRLGIWKMKWELEDISFMILEPAKYNEIKTQISQRRDVREKTVQRVIAKLHQILDKEGIAAEITGRPKHIYSIYRKMERKGVSIEQIYDQLAVRVIVENNDRGECYRVLGIVHSTWPPVQGEFDDYIATPKESLYQSLHTTVLIPGGQPCEVQIRNQEMHKVAEHGIAAHWRYKEGFARSDATFDVKLKWLRGLIDGGSDLPPQQFVDELKKEGLDEQIYVFTPKGKIIDLPIGSTPVDFAYRVHSEIGHNCNGAKVNNRIVPLDYRLQNSEIVQVMTTRNGRGPSYDWLNFVRTSGARNHIRRFLKRLHRDEHIVAGRDQLEKELKRLNLNLPFDEIAAEVGVKSIDDLFAQIGSGDITARTIAQRLLTTHHVIEEELPLIATTPAVDRKRDPTGIQVRGVDGLLTRLARCCNPIVGEPVIGFTTRGRGITIHRTDCRMVVNEKDRARLVEVAWGVAPIPQGSPVPVWIEAWDRVGLWHDITKEIKDASINIDVVEQIPTRKTGRAVLRVTLRINSVVQLTSILDRISRMPDVIEARRDNSASAA
jgi:GTP diphosphokinase / guanosine-3',5'-bis(diphosphate) 3'-diphosphatase